MKHVMLGLAVLFLAACGDDVVNIQSKSPDGISFAYQGAKPPEAVRKKAAEHCAQFDKVSELEDIDDATHSTFVATYKCVAK